MIRSPFLPSCCHYALSLHHSPLHIHTFSAVPASKARRVPLYTCCIIIEEVVGGEFLKRNVWRRGVVWLSRTCSLPFTTVLDFLRLLTHTPFPPFHATSRQGISSAIHREFFSLSVGAFFQICACHFAHVHQISCSLECQGYRHAKLDFSEIQAPRRATPRVDPGSHRL